MIREDQTDVIDFLASPGGVLAMNVNRGSEKDSKIVYWHAELPPLDAQIMGEHTVEAASSRVPGTMAHRDDLWDSCYQDLMARVERRLEQEVQRLGGHCAHVLDEAIESRHDPSKNEAWLRGRFKYVLYRRPER